MKTLKRFVLLPLFCGLLLTTACTEQYENDNGIDNGYYNGDDNGNGDTPFNRTITAVVENGNNYNDIISTVAITLWDYDGRPHTIATGTWSNGGFTITLPETLNTALLYPIFYDTPQDLNISDPSARWRDVWVRAYDEQQRNRGQFSYWSGDDDAYSGLYLFYVDRDVTITGTQPYFNDSDYGEPTIGGYEVWNVQLRAGWNRIYVTRKIEERIFYISIEPISGLRWHFNYDPLPLPPDYLCNTCTPGWGEDLGDVSFYTNDTWTIEGNGVFQIWSDAVTATACQKTTFDGGFIDWQIMENSVLNADCRSNPGFSGDLFTWCAVMRFADQLCPYPWRIPTLQDIRNLDIAMGGTGYFRENIPQFVTDNFINRWGAVFGGASSSDGSLWGQNNSAIYWTQTGAGTQALILSLSPSVVSPFHGTHAYFGHTLRCVRDN